MSGAFDIQEPLSSGVFPGAQQPPQTPPPPAGDNEGKEREFVNQIRKLGRESGAGREALPSLVVAVVDAINTGALDTKKKYRLMDGSETDAAHFIVEQYSLEEGKKLAHERTSLGKLTQASKIRSIIKAAKQENLNFRGAIDRAMEARPNLLANNSKAKLKPAFDTYVSMARTQLKTKAVLTDEQIAKDAMRAPGYKNDFVRELKRMYTRLVKLCSEGTPDGLRIYPDAPIYDSMEQVALAFEAAIKVYEPNFNVPEPAPQAGAGAHPQTPSREGSFAGELAAHNAGVEQKIAEQARQMEPAQ